MREILYRVWNRDTREIFEVNSIDFNSKVVTYYTWENEEYILKEYHYENNELMEYIGREDSEFSSIFVGDILSVKNVFYAHEEPSFLVEVIFDEVMLKYRGLVNKVRYVDFENLNEFTIVGNIFENIDLIY